MTQTSFWASGSGRKITGSADEAFLGDFTLIPDNTVADAMIKKFVFVEKTNDYTQSTDRYYEITWRLCSGDYQNREVSQKIKCFAGKPESIDRALNMMMLVMKLCDYKPSHNNAPSNEDLSEMHGKTLTIKIREWHMPKADGSMMDGNHVGEVHACGDLATQTGVLLSEQKPKQHEPEQSALSRNKKIDYNELNDEIPF